MGADGVIDLVETEPLVLAFSPTRGDSIRVESSLADGFDTIGWRRATCMPPRSGIAKTNDRTSKSGISSSCLNRDFPPS